MAKLSEICVILLLLTKLCFSQDTTTVTKADSEAPRDTARESSLPVGFDQVIENLDFKDADIRDLVRSLSTMYNLNIFIDNSLSARITIHLSNVRVIDAIKFIVNENDLRLVELGSILKILPKEIPPPEPKIIAVEYAEGLLSVDFKDEVLDEAIREISRKTGKTILVDRFATGNLNGMLMNVPFETGLKSLLDNNGFYLQKSNDIYIIKAAHRPFTSEKGTNVTSRGAYYINVEDSLLSLDVYNAPINQLVEEAARRLDQEVFVYGNIEGNISARVDHIRFAEFLSFVFQGSNYTYKTEGDVFLIGDKSVKGLSSSELIKLDYLKTDNILDYLPQSLKSKAELSIIKEQNGLMVIGTYNVIHEIKDYLEKIDKPSPQILIEILVIDFNVSKMRDISIKSGYDKALTSDSKRSNSILPGIDMLFTGKVLNRFVDKAGNFMGMNKIGKLPDDFYIQVKALESEGFAKIISKPQIATLNGYPADISIGQTQYYKLVTQTPYRDANQVYISETEKFETIEANVSLKITPWVSASGEITTEIHPEFKQPVGGFSSEIPPTIASRSLNSTVRLRDGETIVLGGLIQTQIDENTEGIPFLKDIPLLGNLFQSTNYYTSKSEMLIYVTPRLYYADD